MDIIQKILAHRNGRFQYLPALAILLGFLLLMMAIQFYLNVQFILNGKAHKAGQEFLVVNKQINSAMMTRPELSSFNEQELETLQQLPYLKKVVPVISNQFPILAHSMGDLGFSTQLFFESIPAELLDTDSSKWTWKSGQASLPVILSADFLNLYNFGFALSQGLPQLSEESVKALNFQVTVGNASEQETYRAEVVGFTQRYSSILIPESFMQYANQKYGQETEPHVSRLVLQTEEADNPDLQQFLNEHAYVTQQDKLKGSTFARIVRLSSMAISILGLFILLLAYLIQSIYLENKILQHAESLKLMIELGYTPKQLLQFYLKKPIWQIIAVVVFLCLVLIGLQWTLHLYLKQMALEIPTMIHAYLLVVIIICTCILIVSLQQKIKKTISRFI